MFSKIKEFFNNKESYVDPNEENHVYKIPSGFWDWCVARLREPSTMIGLALMLTTVGINVSPAQAGAIGVVVLTTGGFLSFVIREKKNLIHKDRKKKTSINWSVVKGWFVARLKERTSQIGLIMIAAGLGWDFSEHQMNLIASILTFVLGAGAVAHEEGDRKDKWF